MVNAGHSNTKTRSSELKLNMALRHDASREQRGAAAALTRLRTPQDVTSLTGGKGKGRS